MKMRFSQTLQALFTSFSSVIPEYVTARGTASVELMLREKRSQYDAVLGNYDLVDSMVVHDLDSPEQFLLVPGTANRGSHFVSQTTDVTVQNFGYFRSEARELAGL